MDDRMLEILTSRMLPDSASKCKACALPTELNARHTPFPHKAHTPASSIHLTVNLVYHGTAYLTLGRAVASNEYTKVTKDSKGKRTTTRNLHVW